MQTFISSLAENQRKTYQKTALISSMNDSIFTQKHNPSNKSSKTLSSLTNDDLFNMCKYSNPLVAPIPLSVQSRITHSKFGTYLYYHSPRQQNTCLHIAAQFGNVQMVKYLARVYNQSDMSAIDPQNIRLTPKGSKEINERNKNLDTPLMHCLRNNSQHKMEKTVMQLFKYSDLTLRDKVNRLCFQIPLPAYSVSKVRILDFLKEKYQSSI